jgi:predicted ATPase
VDLEIVEPNPFTVFAGPNGSGKSNIFEALEFAAYHVNITPPSVQSLFGGTETITNFNTTSNNYSINYSFEGLTSSISYWEVNNGGLTPIGGYKQSGIDDYRKILEERPGMENSEQFANLKSTMDLFFVNHLHLFIKNESLKRINYSSDKNLFPDASNVEAILKKMIADERKEDLIDWLDLFIPGFENIEIHTDNISGSDNLLMYEKGTRKPFTKKLVSDGTYNILCLLAAVYQTDKPQFLCIEEPENGLNPYVVESLVSFFRTQCEEKGHYIWLNTHSQTLVKELKPHELILVDKVNGETKIKQFSQNYNLHGLEMDTAWLSNALGGGIPW